MAIRIDLLPRYVALQRWFKRILAVCLMLMSTFAAVLFLLYYREQLRLATLKTNVANVRIFADKTDAAQKAADAAITQAKPLQSGVDFLVDAGRTGPERAALLDLIRRYIYNGAVVGSLDISDGKTAKFSGMVQTPDDYARFLLNLRRGTVPVGILFSTLPGSSGILGWPNRSGATTTTPAAPGQPAPAATPAPVPGQPQAGAPPVDALRYKVFPNTIQATAELREPVVVPVAPGETAAAAGAPGALGAPGATGAPPAAQPAGAPAKA